MSDFFGKLKSGAGKVAFEADKMGRLNKAQGELGQIKRQIETSFTRLGETFYQHFNNQDGEAPDYADLCAKITELERQVGVKGEDIQRINAETYNPAGSPPAPAHAPAPIPFVAPAPAAPIAPPTPVEAAPAASAKFCTNCGTEIPVGVKFCPDCGTKA